MCRWDVNCTQQRQGTPGCTGLVLGAAESGSTPSLLPDINLRSLPSAGSLTRDAMHVWRGDRSNGGMMIRKRKTKKLEDKPALAPLRPSWILRERKIWSERASNCFVKNYARIQLLVTVKYEDYCPLGCDAVQCGTKLQTILVPVPIGSPETDPAEKRKIFVNARNRIPIILWKSSPKPSQ
jgi:hypothetical protein